MTRTQRHQARNGASRIRQGLPPLRHRAAARPGRPRDDTGRRRAGSTTTSTTRRWPSSARRATTATGPSTPSASSRTSRCGHGVGLHVDSCLGGFILPFGQELGYDIPVFDYRIPGVTSISADTHKYGYALKGTSVLTFRDKALRNAQYFFLTDWSGGKYCSPGMEGSRSGGLLAATWASMVQLGREGYRHYARAHLRDRGCHAGGGAVPPRAAHLGQPDVPVQLHLGRLRRVPRERLHATTGMAFQRPAVPERPAHGGHPTPDPARCGRSLRRSTSPKPWPTPTSTQTSSPKSGAIYGGVAGGMTDEADAFIKAVMADMMDGHQQVPAGGVSAGLSRAIRPGRRPRHRRPEGRPGVAHRRRRRGATMSPSPPGCCPAAGPSRTPRSGGGSSSTPPGGPCRAGSVRPEQVVAVPCTGQWASTVPVDADGRPVGDCVLWMDSRGAQHARRAVGGSRRRLCPRGRCGAGCGTAAAPRRRREPTPSATCSTSSTTSPTWPERARWYLEPVDYLSMRFTGVAAASPRVDDRLPG